MKYLRCMIFFSLSEAVAWLINFNQNFNNFRHCMFIFAISRILWVFFFLFAVAILCITLQTTNECTRSKSVVSSV